MNKPKKAIVEMTGDELCDEMERAADTITALTVEAGKKFDVSDERAREFATNPDVFAEFLSEFFGWTTKLDAATRTASLVMSEFNKRRM